MSKLVDLLSKQEIKMFTDLGSSDLFQLSSISVLTLYRSNAEECFRLNKQGPAVEALRRGYNALDTCSPRRKTPEFDNLITYENI